MTPRSVFARTLMGQRWPILAWGIGLGFIVISTGIAWFETYATVEARMRIAEQVRSGLSVTEVMYGPAVNLVDIGGAVEWRALGLAPVILGLFMIIAVTGATRGAEESGTLEPVLATPRTRLQVMAEQCAGLFAALLLALAIVAVSVLAAGPLAGEDAIPVVRIAGAMLNLGLAASIGLATGLLASQLTTSRRTAGVSAAAVLFIAHIWSGIGLVVEDLDWTRWFSPLSLYSRSSPMANGDMSWGAIGGMAVVAAVLLGASFYAAARRDLFAAWQPWTRWRDDSGPRRRASTLFLGSSTARAFRDSFGTTLAWAIGLAAFMALMTALAPNVRDAIAEQSDSEIFRQLQEAGLLSDRGIVSLVTSGFVPLLVGLCAVTLAATTGRDETSGRLEMEVAAAKSRRQVLQGRMAGDGLLLIVVAVAAGTGIALTAALTGTDVPPGRAYLASGALVPMALAVLAFSFAVAAWRPSAVLAYAGAAIALSFFIDLLVPLLDLPSAAGDVSVFHLYGQPLIDGVDWPRMVVLCAVALVFAALALRQFGSKDIAR